MVIDSHAHYHNNAYKKPFRYLSYGKDGYALNEGDRDQRFQELRDANIPYSIEPGVSLQSCEEILQLCREYPKRIFPAVIKQIAALKGMISCNDGFRPVSFYLETMEEDSSFKAVFTNMELTECKWLAHDGQQPDEA